MSKADVSSCSGLLDGALNVADRSVSKQMEALICSATLMLNLTIDFFLINLTTIRIVSMNHVIRNSPRENPP